MNIDYIRKILEKFRIQRILQEKDGKYEIIHDIVALKIGDRRTTEENNRIEATRIVYETERLGGELTELQLARISPYIHELAFAEEDKDRLNRFVQQSIDNIEAKKREREEKLKIEQELRATAEREKVEAERLREQAEKDRMNAEDARRQALEAEQKALQLEQMARIAAQVAREAEDKAIRGQRFAKGSAVICFICALVAVFYFFKEKRGHLDAMINAERNLLQAGTDVSSAYEKMNDLTSYRRFFYSQLWPVAFLLKPDSAHKAQIDSLEQILIFHISALRIKSTNKYVAYAPSQNILIRRCKDMPTIDTSYLFKGKFRLLTGFGFADSLDYFWAADQLEVKKGMGSGQFPKSEISAFQVIPDSGVRRTRIDTVNIAAADFDREGKYLYYIKGNTIWRARLSNPGVKDSLFSWKPARRFRPDEKVDLRFLRSPNRALDSYVCIYFTSGSDKDSLHLINIQTGTVAISLPQSGAIDLGLDGFLKVGKRGYLRYTRTEDAHSPVFREYVYDIASGSYVVDSGKDRDPCERAAATYVPSDTRDINEDMKNLYGDTIIWEPALSADGVRRILKDGRNICIQTATEAKWSPMQLIRHLGGADSLAGYQAFNDVYAYVLDDRSKKGPQRLFVGDYVDSERRREFVIPSRWKFVQFVDKKFILFRLDVSNSGAGPNAGPPAPRPQRMESLLLVGSYMCDDDCRSKWFKKQG